MGHAWQGHVAGGVYGSRSVGGRGHAWWGMCMTVGSGGST